MHLFGTKILTAFAILFVNINEILAAPTIGLYLEKTHHLLPRANQGNQYTSCYQLGSYAQYYPQCSGYSAAPASPASPAVGNSGIPQVPGLPVPPPNLPVAIPEELPALPDLSTLKLPALSFGD